MVEITVKLTNKLGLHARAAAKLVAHVSRYNCDISIQHKHAQANAKSIMSLMMLGARCGHQITIIANGEDEDMALEDVTQLIQQRFGENE